MPRLLDTNTGTIPNNLYANEMRVSMENKNLLQTKGAIYVGTGATNSVPVPDNTPNTTGGQSSAAKTMALNPGANGQYLVADSTTAAGLKYQSLSDDQAFADLKDEVDAITIKGKVINITTTTSWTTASTGSPGTYQYTITPAAHGLGATGNISVQLMIPNGTNNWSIVSTTIDVNTNGTIVIYSNIQTVAKVILIGF